MFGGPRKFGNNSGGHNFAQVPAAHIPRSAFDRSHTYRTTFNAGLVVPVYVDEALPGDTFSLKLSTFARLTTPIKPLYDNLYLDVFFFAVPYRLVWSHWEQFNGYQANPGDSTSYLIPTCTSPTGGYTQGTLQDYMGLPIAGQIGAGNTLTHDNLHMRAYNLIFNEWFRDQNLQPSLVVDMGDGPDTYTNYGLFKRAKPHDYFTSALPWPQKGAAVTIPLGTSAPITSTAGMDTYGRHGILLSGYNIASTAYSTLDQISGAPSAGPVGVTPGLSSNTNLMWPKSTDAGYNYADLTNATAATINSLRQAFQLQRMAERDARGGTRYTEVIRAHFGVTSPDMRLQRPEYLGGGRSTINVYPLAQTSPTTGGSTPQGNMAAYGVHSQSGIGFNKSFTEHMLILGLVNVTSDRSYQQGLGRMWSRQTRYDFYWPALCSIGEQSILNQELYCDGSGASGNDGGIFGYQERYAEYRFKPSIITGEFRSTYAQPLDMWHLADDYGSLPSLNASFINDSTQTNLNRCVAVTTEPQIYFDSHFSLKCARPMPVYGVPGNIDRF